MADNYVMRMRAGDTYHLSVTYRDPSDAPINITGYTYEWFVKVGAFEHTYTTTPEITVSSPSTGVILLTLSAGVTATLLTGRGRFFLRVTSGGGEKDTILEGGVEVEFNQ